MSYSKERVDALKLTLVAAQMMDFGVRILLGKNEAPLDVILVDILKKIKALEDYFIYFPNVHPRYKECFQREFNKEEMILMAQLVQTVYGLNSESLENIITAIEKAIDQPENIQS